MSVAQAADALGVRPETVYAYVSRGVLRRTSVVDGSGRRVSLFDRDEVLALADRRRRPQAGRLMALVESDVTSLDPRGRLAFRGHDVADLAALPFEQAVRMLWQLPEPADLSEDGADLSLSADVPPESGKSASESGESAGDRVMITLLDAAGADPRRADVSREHVLAVGARAIGLAVRAVGGPADEPVAAALWAAFTGRTPTAGERAALDAALVALMDHELSASTLALRVAASTGADPWTSLVAGVAALQGPLHGTASRRALAVLRRWLKDRTVADDPPAGFGHVVYDGRDPRFEVIVDRVADLDPRLAAAVDDLAVEVARERSVLPNVDLGLAALTVAGGLPDHAAETIFLVSRLSGFTAHLVEEYGHGLRFRPRAVTSG